MAEEQKKSYYAIIPANVRYDKSLPANAKLLYGEITALCNEKGYCWASNDYFASLYDVSKCTISRWIAKLAKSGYIKTEISYKEGTREIANRYIYLCVEGMSKNVNTPIDEKVKDNTTDINNTVNNIYTDSQKPKKVAEKRKKYGEYSHVLLTDTQYQKLVEEWGKDETYRMIELLDEGIEEKGYKYKNFYLALKKWKSNDDKFTKTKPIYGQSAVQKSGADTFVFNQAEFDRLQE